MLINHENGIIKSSKCEMWNIIQNKCDQIILGWTKFLIFVSLFHILSNKDNFHLLLDYRLHDLHGSHGSRILIFSCYFTGYTLLYVNHTPVLSFNHDHLLSSLIFLFILLHFNHQACLSHRLFLGKMFSFSICHFYTSSCL